MQIWEKIKEIGNRFLARPIVNISTSQMERAMKVMEQLVNVHGWCEQGAATAAAMAMAESGLNPGIEGDKNFKDHAHGMWQWRGKRFEDLEAYAAKMARDWTDFKIQIDYFNEERLSRGPLEKKWHILDDLTEGCYAGYQYERYLGPIQPKREAYAEEFLFEWQGRH
jgi:hypothetical protein